ncbi:MAG: hypothetical protein KF845_00355 [Cyclobacteriaceae bacterium]|nr:hypothetical protein [Cyclobacteriaceae bacterium]
MRKAVLYICMLTGALCDSCSKPEKMQQVHFNNSYSLGGDPLGIEMAETSGLFAIDNYLIASQFSGDHFLKVYDAATYHELGSLAKKGSGVNEFPSIAIIDQYERCGDDHCMWVHDLNKGELIKINLTKSLRSQTTIVDQKVMTRSESRFHTAFYIDSLRVVGRSTNSTPQMNRLQVYNPHSDLILKTVPLFPEIERARTELDFVVNKYNTLYVSNIGIKPDKTRIASAMCSFDRIDIFKTDGELERSIFDGKEIPDNNIEYLDEIDSHKLQMYYGGIFTSDDYIYTLYYGQPFSEYGRSPIPTQIRIFNWSGNALCKIDVKDYLYNFTIDEMNGVMYGVDIVNKRILKYNIKKILDEL